MEGGRTNNRQEDKTRRPLCEGSSLFVSPPEHLQRILFRIHYKCTPTSESEHQTSLSRKTTWKNKCVSCSICIYYEKGNKHRLPRRSKRKGGSGGNGARGSGSGEQGGDSDVTWMETEGNNSKPGYSPLVERRDKWKGEKEIISFARRR